MNTISYGLLIALAIALLVAAFTDIRRRQIDNWLNFGIALAAPAFWWSTGLSLWPDMALQVGVAVVTFLVCSGLFAIRWMGGGDVNAAQDVVREMLAHPATVTGLSDAGAHVTLICDASMPTTQLAFWARDRRRGEQLPLPRPEREPEKVRVVARLDEAMVGGVGRVGAAGEDEGHIGLPFR